MIRKLAGKLLEKQPPLVLIEVSGIGFEILTPMSTFYGLPEINSNLTLLTHLIVRETGPELYGFLSRSELCLFQALIKVSGIGPKTALSILSGMSVSEFQAAVLNREIGRLQKVPGIGLKSAERILLEMRNLNLGSDLPTNSRSGSHHEALSALLALGYKEKEAEKALTQLKDPSTLSSEHMIRQALNILARK